MLPGGRRSPPCQSVPNAPHRILSHDPVRVWVCGAETFPLCGGEESGKGVVEGNRVAAETGDGPVP